ncbi:MAG: methionyl-tRNA formyltransferase [Chthoniobacterales bacterium]
MRVVFIGTGEIGVPVLRWLIESTEHELVGVVTQPDKPVGRGQRIQAPPIKAALEGCAIPILQPDRIKRPEAVAEISALAPDVIVVMAYGQILPRALLEIPRLACLNLHASLLPRHRGAAPIQAAIVEGDPETGLTVMYMDEGLDTGDILLKSRIAIASDETGGSLHDRLGALAPAALAAALAQLETGTAPRIPQDSSAATSAPKLEREHGQIDCSQSAETIARKIRAYDPWPGSYAIIHDATGQERKLKLFGATANADTPVTAGRVSCDGAGDLIIGTFDGSVHLREAQLESKKRMSGVDLLRGHPWIAEESVVAGKAAQR